MNCPECSSIMFEYEEDAWLEWICWECGHYESNTPAFKSCSEMFDNMVRENPQKFIEKHLFRSNFDNKGAKSNKGAKPPLEKDLNRLVSLFTSNLQKEEFSKW